MNAAPLFEIFMTLFGIGLALSIGALVTIVVIDIRDKRRLPLPRATARLRL